MMEWTDDQKKAIYEGGSDILVSAAAGSGKTAVLVERIIEKLLDKDNPVDIDRLLVVTFTEAAASEMKEKIIARIKKSNHPRKREQLRLAGSADITTIDAFCNKCVRNNFHVLGIDPGYNINTDDIELMREEAAQKLFDSLYNTENEEDKEKFYHLLSLYSSNRSDYMLTKLVLNIYDFVQSYAEPFEWLDEKADMYDVSDGKFYSSVWFSYVVENVRQASEECVGDFKELLEKMAEEISGTKMNYEMLIANYPDDGSDHLMNESWGVLWGAVIKAAAVSEAFCSISGEGKDLWDNLHDFYAKASFIMPDGRRHKVKDNHKWVEYNNKYKNCKGKLEEKAGSLLEQDISEIEMQFDEMNVVLHELVWLIKEFDTVYKAEKEKKNVLEFSDIEHLAYELFKNPDVKKEYTDKYDEILIDEYQDTNGLQDAIFRSISKNNIFMVGDLKQSIYRFRGGDPFIFKEKSRNYASGSGGKRIALSQNFRSRKEILESVNAVFGCVMSDEVGDVVYEGDECLNREKDYYTENGCSHTSELHIIPLIKENEDKENIEQTREEAAHVAEEIKKLIDDKYQVVDKDKSGDTLVYRNIKYGDITILSNAVKNIGDIYTEELGKLNIPVFVETEGYFNRREIQLMMSLLKIISNHRQDIPLIGVMRSPIGGFSDDELAAIRLKSMNAESYYDALCRYSDEDEPTEKLAKKCADFIKKLARWRGYIKYQPVAKLIWTLYEETGFYDFIGALEGGSEAQANLRLLYERAKQFEDSGFKGIFNFIRYIERMEKKDNDIAGAKLIGENHDVVRIMTIHKSKGLEFPVVFLVGAGKQFTFSNPDSESSAIHLHKDIGFGTRYINAEHSFYNEMITRKCVDNANRSEMLSENLRKLYVALTRPKEKLIVTVAGKYNSSEDFQCKIKEWESLVNNGVMNPLKASASLSFADWLVPAAMTDNNAWEIKTFERRSKNDFNVDDILSYKYPYMECCGLPSKTTVSDIKQNENETSGFSVNYSMVKMPAFMEKCEAANEIGTAHHQVMECISLSGEMTEEYIRSEIERIRNNGEISNDDAKNINVNFIKEFFDGPLGARMLAAEKAGKLHRESPFEIAVPLEIYDRSFKDDVRFENDKIILQGVIDCWFEEDGEIVLVDYKTDRLGKNTDIKEFEQQKAEQYSIQLELYARAIEEIIKKTVKEKYLYLFSTESVVKL